MKNFKVKWLLLSIVLSIASINTASAGTGYYQEGGKAIQLCFYANGADMWKDVGSSQASAGDIGTVSSLYLKKFYVYAWRDGGSDISWTELHWKIYKESDGTTDGNGWTDTRGFWIQNMSGNNAKYGCDGDANINCLEGLEPGETYIFAYCVNTDNVGWQSNGGWFAQRFTVAEAKTTFESGKYFYLDARNQTNWQSSDFTARFYFKRYDTSADIENVTCTNLQKIESWVYYAEIPEGYYNGKLQIDRVNPNNLSETWCQTPVMAASGRSSALQNCLGGSGSNCGWTPSWGTYCPPKATSTISDNGTVKTWGGSGTSGSPYYVAAGSQIKVSATSTNTLSDANMTTKYDFQVRNASNVQQAHSDGTATTYSYTVPATNNVTYKVRVNAYNSYNSASSTAKWSDASEIYYTARTPYNIAYNKGSNGTGDNVTDVKLNGISITLRGVTYTRTGYTQTAWNTNSAGTGGTSYNLSASYTGNAALSLYPTWTANTTTVTLNANTANHGSGANQSVTATYDAALPSFTATTPATGYHLVGYYTNATSGTKVINADGTFTTNSGVWNRTDGSTLTLWAHYEINTFTVHFNNNYPSGTTGSGSMSNESFTYNTPKNITANAFTCEGYEFAGWKIDNAGDVIAGGTDGCTLTTGNGVTVQLYAQWADNNKYYFKGGKSGSETDWSAAENWTKGAVPSTTDHEVYILSPVKISSGTVHVNSVDIITAGTYKPTGSDDVTASGSKLTIGAGAMLIVDGIVRNYNKSTSTADSTRTSTLHIESDGTHGNGALVWGTANSTPGYAQVDFYSLSGGAKNSNKSINQYVGTPFTSATNHWVYNYYNSWLLGADYSGSAPAWELLGGSDSMDPFKGYCLIYNGSAGNTYQMSGALVTNADQTISLQYKDATKSHNENVLANSWTAPILITALDVENDFTNAEATIYIFNSGSEYDKLSAGDPAINAALPAQWIAIPVNSATWGADPTVEVIPSMQSFSVYSTNDDAELKLDYSALVYDPAKNGDADIVPNRAPKRETEEIAPVVMHLFVNGESGYGDAVWMLEREDFTTGFDNGWDGHKIYGDAVAPQMFVVSPDGEMAVAAVPDFGGTVLGFKAGSEDNIYTFTFDYSEDERPLYLIDMNTQTYTRVVEGNEYIFSTTDTNAHNRFVLTHNAPSIATDIDNLGGAIISDKAVKLIKDGRLFIIRDGGIYDALGTTVK